ncbi:MAG: transposase zinc-binding domain-containing protein [Acidobacteriota bacterium]
MSRVTRENCEVPFARAGIQAGFFGVLGGTALAFWSRVRASSTTYEPRHPAQSLLYQIVRDHFETFRAQAASLRDGEGLPRFVEQEFRDFLQCGWLAGGFVRFHCDDCALDRLVPFSCKSRAVCPSCGGRRMAERAAHLLDVYARGRAGVLTFHPIRCLTALDVEEVLATVEPRITRLLDRRGLGDDDAEGSTPDAWVDEAPVLAGLAAASVQGTVALGPQRGVRLRRLGDPREEGELPAAGSCHARGNGFDLHAGSWCQRDNGIASSVCVAMR